MSVSKIHGAVTLLAALALAGCSGNFYDNRSKGFTPELPEQTYPIDVVKGAVNLRISARTSTLSPREVTSIRRLAASIASMPVPIHVTRPAGSLKAEVKVAHITRLLVDMGVAADRIRHRAVPGVSRIVLSYKRKFAVTRSCDDMWTHPANETASNHPMPGFGCSSQNNLAAMVDNPEDFEHPRVMPPADSDNRLEAIKKFRKKKDFNSATSSQSKVSVKDVQK